jgi:hypothetical protein
LQQNLLAYIAFFITGMAFLLKMKGGARGLVFENVSPMLQTAKTAQYVVFGPHFQGQGLGIWV